MAREIGLGGTEPRARHELVFSDINGPDRFLEALIAHSGLERDRVWPAVVGASAANLLSLIYTDIPLPPLTLRDGKATLVTFKSGSPSPLSLPLDPAHADYYGQHLDTGAPMSRSVGMEEANIEEMLRDLGYADPDDEDNGT